MAIQQHPVPQDISNYKFRLIGDMTIKQFASLGISIVLSVLIYSAPLPFFFKYPLSFTFLLLGVGMAFVPVQGRTLDIWIIAFIKSIYSPTQYIWKHGQEDSTSNVLNTNHSIIQDLQSTNPTPNTPVIEITAPTTKESQLNLSTGLINQVPTPTVEQPESITPFNNSSVIVSPPVAEKKEGDINTVLESKTENAISVTETQTNISTGLINQAPTPTTEQLEPKNESQPTSQTTTASTINDLPPTISGTTPADSAGKSVEPADLADSAALAKTSSLPIPSTPSTPNTLVGLTLSPDGKTLDGVMVEIKNQNLTLRATKSNKLGQFLFVRPLENGLYQILAEKDDYKFETYSIELNGEIMNPLKIQALK